MLWWERLGFTTRFPPFPPSPTASTQLLPACPRAWHPAGTKRPSWRGRMGRGTPTAHCPLSLPSHCSAAGEFFPEAAQVAYRMWELSAVAKVEVSTPQPLLFPPLLLPASLGPPAAPLCRGARPAPHLCSASCSAASLDTILRFWGTRLAGRNPGRAGHPPSTGSTNPWGGKPCMSVQCITRSPGSGARRRNSCSPGAAHPGTRALHAAGDTHKRALWDVQRRHPERTFPTCTGKMEMC